MRLGQLKQLHSFKHQALQKQKGLLLGWGWPPTCGGSRPAGNREAILAEQLGGRGGWALIWGTSLSPQHLSCARKPEPDFLSAGGHLRGGPFPLGG